MAVAGKGLEIIGPKMSRSSFRAGAVAVVPLVTGASAGPSQKKTGSHLEEESQKLLDNGIILKSNKWLKKEYFYELCLSEILSLF